jgi:hypothetical protein
MKVKECEVIESYLMFFSNLKVNLYLTQLPNRILSFLRLISLAGSINVSVQHCERVSSISDDARPAAGAHCNF